MDSTEASEPLTASAGAEPEAQPGAAPEPFPTIEALRTVHADQSRRLKETKGTPEFWADVKEFIARASATGSVLDDDGDRSAAQAILNLWANNLYRANPTLREVDPTLVDYCDSRPARDLSGVACPYAGLSPFDESQRTDFFGREAILAEAMKRLESGRFLAVVASTGRGKTSLLRAGLLPTLRERHPDWRVLPPIEPGPDLLGRLVRAVAPERAQDAVWVRQQVSLCSQDPAYIARIATETDPRPVVLAVDRFEKAFVTAPDADDHEARTFAKVLAALATTRNPAGAKALRHTVIIAVRWEALAQFARMKALKVLLDRDSSQLLLELPNADSLREMIKGPANRVGLKFDEGIVDSLVRGVIGDPWSLSVLEYALVKLWEAGCKDGLISWKDYNEVLGEGGVRGALGHGASRSYRALYEYDKVVAQRVLVRLVRPGAGREVSLARVPLAELLLPPPKRRFQVPIERLTRAISAFGKRLPLPGNQPASESSILPMTVLWHDDDPETVKNVIEKLRVAGIVRVEPGDDGALNVELASEALLDKWPELAVWVYEKRRNEDTEARSQRYALKVAAVATTLVSVFAALAVAAVIAVVFHYLHSRYRMAEAYAKSRLLIDYTYGYRTGQYDLALLLGIRSYERAKEEVKESGNRVDSQATLGEARNALLFTMNSSPRLDRFYLSGRGAESVPVVALSPDGRTLALAKKVDERQYKIGFSRLVGDDSAPTQPVQTFETEENLKLRPIWGLAFSSNGQLLATGGGEHVDEQKGFRSEVCLWDVKNAEPPRKLGQVRTEGLEGPVVGLAFSPDDRTLATITEGRYDHDELFAGRVRLWDVSDPSKGPVEKGKGGTGHRGPGISAMKMLGLAFSRDGKVLVTGGGGSAPPRKGNCTDGELAFWDVDNLAGDRPEPARVLKLPQPVCALALWGPSRPEKPGKSLMAAGCLDGSVALIDPEGPSTLSHLPVNGPRHHGFVRSLAFDALGKRLATGGDDTAVIVWDVSNPHRPRAIGKPMSGHNGNVLALAFERERGQGLRSAAQDETWVRWDLSTANVLAKSLRGAPGPVKSAVFRPGKGDRIATASDRPDDDATGPGAKPVSFEEAYAVRLWDVSNDSGPRPIDPPLQGHTDTVSDLAFSPDGNLLASAGKDRRILLWGVDPPRRLGEIGPADVNAHTDQINSLRFRPDRKERVASGRGASRTILASASNDKLVKLWDVTDPSKPQMVGKPLGSTEANAIDAWWVAGLSFSPDGNTLATAHWDKTVRLWDVTEPENARAFAILIGHDDAALCASFSPDGRWLASGGMDNTIVLWDLKNIAALKHEHAPAPRKIRPFHLVKFHHEPIGSVSFSRDGQWLASASDDDTTNLHLWDTTELYQRRSLGPQMIGQSGKINRVTFDYDADRNHSGRMISAGEDGSVLIWNLSPEFWVDRARRRVNRHLTSEELAIFGLEPEPHTPAAR